ncbi:MAG: alpha-mannosidase [Gomphosphaeria aponina SAG 52.96 = DSM 107014]|uniref:Alpha-mannosidase n=1 Tax=Gomphosphaeria aponina SAG 52.96 = DSM 107014 TaxID=1521640 RepID=A0A941GV10_9CHRO|nr:alpha-mannosidase [Gomphosphaeria aponina SAG 52.96 = DSM 107014]
MLKQTITKLYQLSQVDVQSTWRYSPRDQVCPVNEPLHWNIAPLNAKGYVIFPRGNQVQWLVQKFIVPPSLHDYPLAGLSLRLVLTWWAELAEIFVNGKLVQVGDLFDSSAPILLTSAATSNQIFLVALRLISPGHDLGALMRSKLIYEATNLDPGFVADELTILSNYLTTFAPEQLNFLETAVSQIDWSCLSDAQKFNHTLSLLRQNLLPLSAIIKQRCFYLLGHAHLDLAWLWTTAETYTVAQRTFTSVLNLQQDFPSLTFCHSTPALYAWIENHRPALFAAIQKAVSLGKWEVLGGMWVEPEVNLISGESLVRQLLYGQQYFQAKFGKVTQVAWLPDSFGFPWQLPQILHQSGIKYFVTSKLHWHDTTTFPYGCFWWEAPDGTRIFTILSPPNVTGVMDTNPITMTNYSVSWEQQTGLQDIFWLPGVGDHGGGPTRDMLEVQQRWLHSPFFPQMEFTTAFDYLQRICYSPPLGKGDNKGFPVWRDELYLEFHRGCYTNYIKQKYFNRYCEGLLYQGELFSSLAILLQERVLIAAQFPMQKKQITKQLNSQEVKEKIQAAWKKVLFNQFHDILPGTGIGEVFVEANKAWEEVVAWGEEIVDESLKAIAAHIILPFPPEKEGKPIFIFNPLNWKRSEVVTVSLPPGNWEIYNLEGEKLPTQLTNNNSLLFLAENIPAVGYRCFWLVPVNQPLGKGEVRMERSEEEFILENELLRGEINPETGDIKSIWDKIEGREILSGPGNQLQSFQDEGQYWDAWNIDPNYQQYPLPPTELNNIAYLEKGPIQWRVRVVRKLGKSEFVQDYLLQINSPVLKITTQVNWQETHVLVKAAFPLNLVSNFATYEIACGAINRSNRPVTAAEKAKWEVAGHRWADLTENNNYGVSLLNNCQYGYDSQPSQLRLTLLRSSTWPDPKADRGKIHHFTYGLYPHRGGWQSGKTVHKGYELNLPLQVVLGEKVAARKGDLQLPSVGKLLDLGAENLILMALKPAEADAGWILRCYECHGERAELNLTSDLDLTLGAGVDLLERDLPAGAKMSVEPWKIVSFRVELLVDG